MNRSLPSLAAAILTLSPLGLAAQTTPNSDLLDEEMVASVLEQLQTIQDEVAGGSAANRRTALERYQAATATDKTVTDFYMTCVRELNFVRNEASASDFRDWENRNEDRLKRKAVVAAMRTQLSYLTLSIKAAEAEDLGEVIPDLRSFLQGLVAAVPEFVEEAENPRGPRGGGGGSALQMLKAPVTGTVFARAYRLDQTLEVEDWEFAPLNIAGIYSTTIIPYALDNSPTEVPALWDERINYQHFIAEATLEPAALTEFEEGPLPSLRWEAAMDTFAIGQQVSGTKAMLDLIKTNPAHPDCPGWIQDLRSTVVDGYNTGFEPETPCPPAPGAPAAPTAP